MKAIKNITVISLLFCIGVIGFTACEKIEKDTPQAIKKLVRETKKEHGCLGRVFELEYNNEHIYCFEPHPDCFDVQWFFYDEKGNKLWEDGGWGRIGTYLEDFYEKAIFKRVIWKEKDWYDINKK